MAITLYAINETYLELLELLEQTHDEELITEIQEMLDNLNDELGVKADNYAVIIKRLESDIEMIKNEEKRLKDKRFSIENNIDKLKRNLEETMILQDKKKFKTDKFSFNIQKNKTSVYFTNEDLIPEEYKETITTIKTDKKKLYDDLKEGVIVEGAELRQSESIRIK